MPKTVDKVSNLTGDGNTARGAKDGQRCCGATSGWRGGVIDLVLLGAVCFVCGATVVCLAGVEGGVEVNDDGNAPVK